MKDYEQFFDDLYSLVAIKSIRGEKMDGAPFGEGPKRALELFLRIADKMGFKTVNYDNYAGEVVFGNGEEIGIIGHLDVVSEGEGWETPPYELTFKDDNIIGRGVMDDKGPMLLCLYVLKELKDSGIVPKKKIRFFVGTNEESSWEDVAYLKTKTTIPEYGFSPDGNFPVSYAEKGFYFIETFLPAFKNFGAITGGTHINAVCARAETVPVGNFDENLLSKYGLSFTDGKIVSIGVSAHGSRPDLGKNALLPLLKFLKESGEDVGDVIDCLFSDKYGITKMKNEQGYVTLSPNLAEKNIGGGTKISCDCRIPAPFTVNDVAEKTKAFPFSVKIIDHDHPPVCVDKNGKLVQTLIGAYNKVTGANEKPVSMGGSTFARVFSKGCAFGPEFPDTESTIHSPNERVSKSDLLKIYEIYRSAIFDLATK